MSYLIQSGFNTAKKMVDIPGIFPAFNRYISIALEKKEHGE
jgi:hypothetical protein